MSTRRFKENYSNDREVIRDINYAQDIGTKMVEQIEFYILYEDLNSDEKRYLENCKKVVEEILNKYEYSSRDQKIESFDNFKMDFEKIFEFEESIYKSITLPLWKKFITPVEKELKPGDDFAYIVHCGEDIIYLPGFPGYRKTRNLDGDFVSSSLISNKQISTYLTSKVGLILNPESYICADVNDACTTIDRNNSESINRVLDFNNGKYIITRSVATKIQSPKHLQNESIKKYKNLNPLLNMGGFYNEVVLNDSIVKVLGVFLQTNGCEINLEDYHRAMVMRKVYNVPLKVENMALHRKNAGYLPYESDDYDKFINRLQYWNDMNNVEREFENCTFQEIKELLEGYYDDVVVATCYDETIKHLIYETFMRIIEHYYFKLKIESSKSIM